MNIIIFSLYDKQIRKPMIEKKFKHLRLLAERKDFDQILFLQNQDDDTFNTLRKT